MKNKLSRTLSEAIGNIDEKYIEEAALYNAGTRRRVVRLSALAAALAIVIFAGANAFLMMMPAGRGKGESDDNLQYTAYVFSGDTIDSLDIGQTHPIWNPNSCNSYEDAFAPREASVSFEGKTYTGEYIASVLKPGLTSAHHQYSGDGAYFTVDSRSGALVFIVPEESVSDDALTDDSRKAIAEGIAKKYIDVREYELVVYKLDVAGSVYANVHGFQYLRKADGCKTYDSLEIAITLDGNHVRVTLPRASINTNEVDFDLEKAKEALTDKVEEVYKTLDGFQKITKIQIDEGYLNILDDGSFAMSFTASVSYTVENASLTVTDFISVVVCAEYVS